jgi:hypothetical protein
MSKKLHVNSLCGKFTKSSQKIALYTDSLRESVDMDVFVVFRFAEKPQKIALAQDPMIFSTKGRKN